MQEDQNRTTEYSAIEAANKYFEHYGVKGMKWGERKEYEPVARARMSKIKKTAKSTAKTVGKALKPAVQKVEKATSKAVKSTGKAVGKELGGAYKYAKGSVKDRLDLAKLNSKKISEAKAEAKAKAKASEIETKSSIKTESVRAKQQALNDKFTSQQASKANAYDERLQKEVEREQALKDYKLRSTLDIKNAKLNAKLNMIDEKQKQDAQIRLQAKIAKQARKDRRAEDLHDAIMNVPGALSNTAKGIVRGITSGTANAARYAIDAHKENKMHKAELKNIAADTKIKEANARKILEEASSVRKEAQLSARDQKHLAKIDKVQIKNEQEMAKKEAKAYEAQRKFNSALKFMAILGGTVGVAKQIVDFKRYDAGEKGEKPSLLALPEPTKEPVISKNDFKPSKGGGGGGNNSTSKSTVETVSKVMQAINKPNGVLQYKSAAMPGSAPNNRSVQTPSAKPGESRGVPGSIADNLSDATIKNTIGVATLNRKISDVNWTHGNIVGKEGRSSRNIKTLNSQAWPALVNEAIASGNYELARVLMNEQKRNGYNRSWSEDDYLNAVEFFKHFNIQNGTEIEHHGVKGMKWGERREQRGYGSSSPSARRLYRNRGLYSDEELQRRVNRLQTETRLKDLKNNERMSTLDSLNKFLSTTNTTLKNINDLGTNVYGKDEWERVRDSNIAAIRSTEAYSDAAKYFKHITPSKLKVNTDKQDYLYRSSLMSQGLRKELTKSNESDKRLIKELQEENKRLKGN